MDDLAGTVLIDMRADAPARLYSAPQRVIRADGAAEVAPALVALRAALAQGQHVAGYLTYEAGVAMQPRALPMPAQSQPLLWFGVYDAPRLLDHAKVRDWLPPADGVAIGGARPRVGEADHAAAFARIHDWIEGGDIYQANLTIRADVALTGAPAAAYGVLRDRARAGHCAFVDTGADAILSLSPELCFDLRAGRITARPMKGTAPRHADPMHDASAADMLGIDPKQRAENLMIVDLLRNDLSRVARAGSVAVPALFAIETYPSVHQMTSTITADLLPDRDAIDVLAATFPCGSITGAPKLRAMEVIAAVEPTPRGVYCGSIGWIAPDGDASFNVAIRTLHLPAGAAVATLGLGSAIVADSVAADEWDECLTKARFLA
ncbi:aminodeoxychorismate synthase component I [Sphingomonas sp. RS2018]